VSDFALMIIADFRKMWTWNTAHIFAYVVADYETKSHVRNEVVIWDTILSSKADALISRTGQWNKYSLRDHGYGLRGADVSLQLRYSIMPHMGVLMYGAHGEHNFTLPSAYSGATSSY
jgi:signal peptidase complex subunit 3